VQEVLPFAVYPDYLHPIMFSLVFICVMFIDIQQGE